LILDDSVSKHGCVEIIIIYSPVIKHSKWKPPFSSVIFRSINLHLYSSRIFQPRLMTPEGTVLNSRTRIMMECLGIPMVSLCEFVPLPGNVADSYKALMMLLDSTELPACFRCASENHRFLVIFNGF
jgi:hypothetical protein